MEAPTSIDIGTMRPDEVDAVSQIHFEFFGGEGRGHSLARLGPRFLADVFYRPNLDNPHLFVDVVRAGGELAAFSVYTSNSALVFRHALRQHPLLVAAGLARQVLTAPLRTSRHVLSNLGFVGGSSQPPEVAGIPGAFLLLGVREAYRSREFRERTGVWIAGALWDRLEANLRNAGCPALWAAAVADGEGINRLLVRMGCIEVARRDLQGLPCIIYRRPLAPAQPQGIR